MNDINSHLREQTLPSLKQSVVLSCRGLSKKFVQGTYSVDVLSGIDLDVHKGERVAIVGASGSGKSTLLHLLGGLDTPTLGRVSLLGRDFASLNEKTRGDVRNTALGFVYQFHHLLPEFSAVENIVLPQLANGVSKDAAQTRALELLDQVGIANRASHRPAELSGGEQQRVAFCRALANAPRLLLADEPTGNLDPTTSDQVFAILMELVRGTGLSAVIATHNLELAARMDRQIRLDAGQLVPQ